MRVLFLLSCPGWSTCYIQWTSRCSIGLMLFIFPSCFTFQEWISKINQLIEGRVQLPDIIEWSCEVRYVELLKYFGQKWSKNRPKQSETRDSLTVFGLCRPQNICLTLLTQSLCPCLGWKGSLLIDMDTTQSCCPEYEPVRIKLRDKFESMLTISGHGFDTTRTPTHIWAQSA